MKTKNSSKFTNREKFTQHLINIIIGMLIFYFMGLLTLVSSFVVLITVLLATELGFFLLDK